VTCVVAVTVNVAAGAIDPLTLLGLTLLALGGLAGRMRRRLH
jgi:LPXTG-motif cell wall-anchored protein